MCLSGVFNYKQIVTLGDVADSVHLSRFSHEVYGHDGAGFFSDRIFNPVGIDVEGVPFDIDESGNKAGMKNGIARGNKGKGGHYDLISAFCSEIVENGKSEGIGIGSATDGYRLFCACKLGKTCFEFSNVFAAGDPCRIKGLVDEPS